MEVQQHNEVPGTVMLPHGGLSERQLRLLFGRIRQHPQIICAQRIDHHIAVLIDVGALTGTLADQSSGLVLAFVKRKVENAKTVRKLSRKDLVRVR